MHSFRLAAAVLPLLLSSCMLGPDHAPPETPLPEKFSEGAKQSAGDVAVSAWWDSFSDRTLNQYVASGLDENLSVQQALERVNAAAADVTIAGAGAFPRHHTRQAARSAKGRYHEHTEYLQRATIVDLAAGRIRSVPAQH